ncbi:MAG: hypothetical protein IPP07_06710 [Holophagales bacterium]|nr:hypothetical protein [Holophagales bacterium]
MKGLLMSGALALAVAGPAYGLAALLTDDFSYGVTAGNLTTITTNWTAHGAGAGWVGYQASTLSLSGYTFGGTGGAATIAAAGSEDINRAFGAQSGDIYVSALMNFSAAGTGSYFFHLKDATTNFRARVFAQNVGGALRFGLHSTSTGTYSPTDFAFNTTYLVVVHYNGTTGATDLWVLTTVPATAPTPLLSQTDATILATMEGIAIRDRPASSTESGSVRPGPTSFPSS